MEDNAAVRNGIARLEELTRGGDYIYYVNIAHFMVSPSLDGDSPARRIGGEQPTRQRWRSLATTFMG
ncbi:hypothetical protein [Streptomyces sp. Ncost-T10-10d]|uniref:hypothetical protein n=1 Tax=Streptomyces sp. Ncost-T10-10d TaxID=1839774 RepID=UPI00081D7B12|nr:hypothetical protein [Streptomyces sp. Ncost-T10-10d]SCF57640.1 hypothetical protein GA0115254_10425 [Streptomyces sp. Ncost-T10-10d]